MPQRSAGWRESGVNSPEFFRMAASGCGWLLPRGCAERQRGEGRWNLKGLCREAAGGRGRSLRMLQRYEGWQREIVPDPSGLCRAAAGGRGGGIRAEWRQESKADPSGWLLITLHPMPNIFNGLPLRCLLEFRALDPEPLYDMGISFDFGTSEGFVIL